MRKMHGPYKSSLITKSVVYFVVFLMVVALAFWLGVGIVLASHGYNIPIVIVGLCAGIITPLVVDTLKHVN